MKLLSNLYQYTPRVKAVLLEKAISLLVIGILLMILGAFTPQLAYGQDSRNVESTKKAEKIKIDKSQHLLNRFQHQNMSGYLDGLQEEYVRTMKAVAKKYKQEAKLKAKRRNQDYAYFGHKHKPRKRRPGKKKFCEECMLIH